MHCDQELIVFVVYNFQIWNRKEVNIIMNRIIICYTGHMNIETPYSLKKAKKE